MRWNISNIFFFGVENHRRDLSFRPSEVNIITGASGTGKSTLIKAIDYCLGSSKCELPAYVKRRAIVVGVKWVSDQSEMIIARCIPPVGQDTDTHMFTVMGKNLHLPSDVKNIQGPTTLGAAKAFIESAFGISDTTNDLNLSNHEHRRATVRHVTPYLFVTKEVIYSESVLLHGLEKADEARDIVATMPYFLGVVDGITIVKERQLQQLKRNLTKAEAIAEAKNRAATIFRQKAMNLLTEAHRIGLSNLPEADASEDYLKTQLKSISDTSVGTILYPNEDEVGLLHAKRREVLDKLQDVRRRIKASKLAIREASGFETAVDRQKEKLILADALCGEGISKVCPLCDSPSEVGIEAAKSIQSTLLIIKEESLAIERVKPKLVQYDLALDTEIEHLNMELKKIDELIQGWFRQNEEVRNLANLDQVRVHLLGRISYFLEESVHESSYVLQDLNVLRAEIYELELQVNAEAKATQLRIAENKISNFASESLIKLPTIAPCVGAELSFTSKKPQIHILEENTGAILKMSDVGSDQNYLAVHIALSFAFQQYFESIKAPVPGLLVLDQISRPYFPTNGNEYDEKEIRGEDEDIQAMRKHIDFLFAETAAQKGLQVLLIEHAYFADDSRYVSATCERWTRVSKRALIPINWPIRDDKT